MDNFKLNILSNGIKVIEVQDTKAQLLYINLSINVGSDLETYEDKSVEIAHFLEHIFATFTSKKYPSALKNNELFARLGVYVNASVIEKRSNYILKVPAEHFSRVLDIVYHTIKDFVVDPKIFDQEKNAIKEELFDILNDTWINLEEKVNTILYPNSPRSFGEKKRVKEVIKATPQNLINFYKKYYRTNNMSFGIYGSITNQISKEIQTKLGSLKETCGINYSKYLYNNPNFNTGKIYFVKCQHAESYNLNLIFKIPHLYFSLEQNIASGILNVLTLDLESLLTKRLRTIEGLVYNVDSHLDFDEYSNDLSIMTISTTIEQKNIQKVLNIIFEILTNIKEKLIDSKEITKYRATLRSEKKDRLTQKEPFSILNFYTHNALWDQKIITYLDYYKKISSISRIQMKNYAERFLTKDNLIIAYGGKKNLNLKIPPNL
jgi:predicted Zn-dependent peptidase